MDAILEVQRLCCVRGPDGCEALHDVGLTVRPGEVILLAGKSGCGKSTLIHCACGLIPRIFPGQVRGSIELYGRTIGALATWEIAQRAGLAFQNPDHQLFTDTVQGEAAFGPENLALPQEEVAHRVEDVLRRTGLLGLRHRLTRTLSFGQKRRVGIAGVLSLKPRLFLLDEPASVLDDESARSIIADVARLAAEMGGAVLVAEHRLGYVIDHATRLVVMDRGSIVYDGSPAAAWDHEFRARHGLRAPACEFPKGPQFGICSIPAAGPVLQARRVCFSYAGHRPTAEEPAILADVNLDVAASAATVVAGPNGSGKTTLLKILAGLLRPTSGTVRWCDGSSAAAQGMYSRGRGSSIAYVGHQPLYLFRRGQVLRELASWLPPKTPLDLTVDIAERLDIRHLFARHPLALSEGESRRLAIAGALAAQPRVLILDEPSVGFDGHHMGCLLDALDRYMASGGALVVASNDQDFLCRLPTSAVCLSAIQQVSTAFDHPLFGSQSRVKSDKPSSTA